MALGDILGAIGNRLTQAGAAGSNPIGYAQLQQDQQAQQAIQQAIQAGGTPAEMTTRLAQIGTPAALQYAKILADQAQKPAKIAEFEAVQALSPDQQAAYQKFANPEAALKQETAAVEKQQAQNAADQRFLNTEARMRNILETINTAKSKVAGNTAGALGTVASYLPATPARDLAATLDTVKANLGFEELQAMRDASKTGGALGSVTENELKYLQSVKASLDQGQSPKQLRENLNKAQKQIQESWKRINEAYRKDGGLAEIPQQSNAYARATQPNVPKVGTVEDGYRFKGGNPADQNNWEKQ